MLENLIESRGIVEEKFNKNLKFEDYDAYYYRLVQIGKAMFDLYDCKSLSNEQIDLLAMSSNDDKIHGMDIVMSSRLVLNKNYNVYRRNSDSIKALRLLRLSNRTYNRSKK